MDIVVAGHACAVEIAELDGCAVTTGILRLDVSVAVVARNSAVVTAEEIAIIAVGVFGELEGLSSVATLASITQLTEVNVAVTGLAGSLHSLEANRAALAGGEVTDLALVAGNALDGCVLTGERERGPRVLEICRLELVFVDPMTACTVRSELSKVGVLVAVCTGDRQVAVAA